MGSVRVTLRVVKTFSQRLGSVVPLRFPGLSVRKGLGGGVKLLFSRLPKPFPNAEKVFPQARKAFLGTGGRAREPHLVSAWPAKVHAVVSPAMRLCLLLPALAAILLFGHVSSHAAPAVASDPALVDQTINTAPGGFHRIRRSEKPAHVPLAIHAAKGSVHGTIHPLSEK